MLTEICAEIRNYFEVPNGRCFGKFEISGGSVSPLILQQGQYFRIMGSVFNDGIHQYPAYDLTDEVFDGAVWALAIPPAFLSLCDEIKAYCESAEGKTGAYVSESFGGYAYTKAVGQNGAPLSWKSVFAERLNGWRKL